MVLSLKNMFRMTYLQCDTPYRGHPTNFFLQVSQSGYLPPCS